MDDLSEVVEQNRKARQEDIAKGMQIICGEAATFMDWFSTRDIGPLIGQMKEKFIQISRSELKRFFMGTWQKASCKETPCKEMMEAAVDRVVNKLLHCVIKNVDAVTKENGPTEAAKLVDSIVRQAEAILSKPGDKADTQP